MNDGDRLEVKDEVGSNKASDGNEVMSECLTREGVEQALGSFKKRSTPGSDGLTAEMVCCNVLMDVWCSLQLVLEVWNDSLRVEEKCNSSYTKEEESGCVQSI